MHLITGEEGICATILHESLVWYRTLARLPKPWDYSMLATRWIVEATIHATVEVGDCVDFALLPVYPYAVFAELVGIMDTIGPVDDPVVNNESHPNVDAAALELSALLSAGGLGV